MIKLKKEQKKKASAQVYIPCICTQRHFLYLTSPLLSLSSSLPSPLSFQSHFGDECKFKEILLPNNYNAYESQIYPGMYMALSKNGRTKKGNKVSPTMTVTHFLPRIWELSLQSYLRAEGKGKAQLGEWKREGLKSMVHFFFESFMQE